MNGRPHYILSNHEITLAPGSTLSCQPNNLSQLTARVRIRLRLLSRHSQEATANAPVAARFSSNSLIRIDRMLLEPSAARHVQPARPLVGISRRPAGVPAGQVRHSATSAAGSAY